RREAGGGRRRERTGKGSSGFLSVHVRSDRSRPAPGEAGLEVAAAWGYIPPVNDSMAAKLRQVIGTLVRLT
ncbi:MAG TPA: hypothetical protein VGI39_24755, partial [Polyangiaceae bacterium]